MICLCLFEVFYKPYYGFGMFAAYIAILSTLTVLNGYIHYRLRRGSPVTSLWLMSLHALDVLAISVAIAISGGFNHYFFYLFYYPALAAFAAMFTSFCLNIFWVTLVALIYVTLSLTVGDGLDAEGRGEKVLLARVAVMYAVVFVVNMASSFERNRWEGSAERERALQRERAGVSRTIHDTAAQTAYMVSLGIHRARELARDSDQELVATLDATADLAKTAIWELRNPLNAGNLLIGASLSSVLQSHVATFTTVTSVPAQVVQDGVEPALSAETRSCLFSIAHNSLTNAFRHSRASRVEVELNFGEDSIRMSVTDDGVGRPEDYASRGYGFAGMRADAEAIGGRLVVEPDGALGGATVTCVVPR